MTLMMQQFARLLSNGAENTLAVLKQSAKPSSKKLRFMSRLSTFCFGFTNWLALC